jgi:nucleotide-binding universal stress UspA family protein
MNKMKIVIAYDGSSYADAALDDLRRAGLPRETEALVISVADVWSWPPPGKDTWPSSAEGRDIFGLRKAQEESAQAIEEARRLAVQAAARVQAAFPSWHVEAEGYGDSPAWAVIKQASERGSDLVVVGTQGRSALNRFMLGSVSQKVLYEAGCSVRVARRSARGDDSPPRLVIGMDGSPDAEAALNAVAARDWPRGTEARVIAAQSPLAPLAFSHFIQPIALAGREYIADRSLFAQKVVDAAAERLRQAGLVAAPLVIEGDAKRVLIDEAERWGADCIFVGARGLRRLERFLLGSVSSSVAAGASCSVEVVRSPEAASASPDREGSR